MLNAAHPKRQTTALQEGQKAAVCSLLLAVGDRPTSPARPCPINNVDGLSDREPEFTVERRPFMATHAPAIRQTFQPVAHQVTLAEFRNRALEDCGCARVRCRSCKTFSWYLRAAASVSSPV